MKSERRCCCSITKSCLFAALESSLLFTISQNLLKLTSIESVMSSNHLIFCCLLLLLPSIFPRVRVFSNELALHIRWPKYWHFSFSISPSSEYSGLISFRIDWFDLLAVQGTLKLLLSNPTVQKHQFFSSEHSMIQLSHPYITVGKIIPLTIWTSVSKVISLLFNTLSRFVIAMLSQPYVPGLNPTGPWLVCLLERKLSSTRQLPWFLDLRRVWLSRGSQLA